DTDKTIVQNQALVWIPARGNPGRETPTPETAMTDLSYQLYSSRNFPPLTETLKMLAGLGYSSVEGYGALYADPAKVAELVAGLKESSLTMPTGHFSLDMLEQEPSRVLEIAGALGIER